MELDQDLTEEEKTEDEIYITKNYLIFDFFKKKKILLVENIFPVNPVFLPIKLILIDDL